MQTKETLDRAIAYAADLISRKGVAATIVSVHMRTNGYEYPDKRAAACSGHAVKTTDENGTSTLVVWHDEEIKDATNAFYILDDGHTAEPRWVGGYGPADHPTAVFLKPFPMNFHPDGTRVLREDDRRPVDYHSWMLAPSRAYHVKVSDSIPALRACACGDNCPWCKLPPRTDGPCSHGKCAYCRAKDAGYVTAVEGSVRA